MLSLVERRTGYLALGKLAAQSTAEATRAATALLRRQPRRVRTVTADNGTEFHDHATIERHTGAVFYFATPHHAWERGTNENTNGLLRQYLPKGQRMAHLTQRDCERLAHTLNTRPRKRLGYRTPEECYGLWRRTPHPVPRPALHFKLDVRRRPYPNAANARTGGIGSRCP